jgi:hypothetical protein
VCPCGRKGPLANDLALSRVNLSNIASDLHVSSGRYWVRPVTPETSVQPIEK